MKWNWKYEKAGQKTQKLDDLSRANEEDFVRQLKEKDRGGRGTDPNFGIG